VVVFAALKEAELDEEPAVREAVFWAYCIESADQFLVVGTTPKIWGQCAHAKSMYKDSWRVPQHNCCSVLTKGEKRAAKI